MEWGYPPFWQSFTDQNDHTKASERSSDVDTVASGEATESERHRRTLAVLIAFHEDEAEKLLETDVSEVTKGDQA
jgi:hypothetical protein